MRSTESCRLCPGPYPCSPKRSNHERRSSFQHVAPRGVDRSLYFENRVHLAAFRCRRLRLKDCLDSAALVHRAVAFRNLIQREGKVEDFAGIDLFRPDQIDELRQKVADWCGTAMKVNVREEQLLSLEFHVMRNADIADVATLSCGADRLHH